MAKDKYLLRLTTAGSVDDGKSTLIGRLLLDSGSLYQDQIRSIEQVYLGKGASKVDLAHFTDGLKEERELGITIDVAYRYFQTEKCKFILADSPGHLEFTRNMITAASTCDAAILLVDAQAGILEQTRRHAYLASLLNIGTLIICVNKMDLIDWSESAYLKIVQEMEAFLKDIRFNEHTFIPISALEGDNVVNPSEKGHWYAGLPVLQTLENIKINSSVEQKISRLPVQLVLKQGVIAGKIAEGTFRVNEQVELMPSGTSAQIKSIYVGSTEVEQATTGMSISMHLTENSAIKRGDVVVKSADQAEVSDQMNVRLCWLGDKPAKLNVKYSMHHATSEIDVTIVEVSDEVETRSFQMHEKKSETGANAIVHAKIHSESPVVFDAYRKNRVMGSFILVDCSTNETVAGGIIL